MISVIVPAYNSSETLFETVRSIMDQTYSDIEIIIVNDGSEDETKKVMDLLEEQYPDKIVCIHTENQGVTSARMSGISAAKGEWIGFCDSDDVIEKDMYEILLKNALKYGAQISHCGYQMISDTGEVRYFYDTERTIIQDNIKGIEDLLNGDYVEPSLCNKLFHRSLFIKMMSELLMDRKIKHNEDLLMNYYLFREADISVFYDVCKYHYLVHGREKEYLKATEHRIYDPIRVREIILSDIPDMARDTAEKVYLRTCIYVYNGLVGDSDSYGEDLKKIRQMIKRKQKAVSSLTNKLKICACLIIYTPFLYDIIYRIYSKHFLRSKYL